MRWKRGNKEQRERDGGMEGDIPEREIKEVLHP